jgi:hypothetical protein
VLQCCLAVADASRFSTGSVLLCALLSSQWLACGRFTEHHICCKRPIGRRSHLNRNVSNDGHLLLYTLSHIEPSGNAPVRPGYNELTLQLATAACHVQVLESYHPMIGCILYMCDNVVLAQYSARVIASGPYIISSYTSTCPVPTHLLMHIVFGHRAITPSDIVVLRICCTLTLIQLKPKFVKHTIRLKQ